MISINFESIDGGKKEKVVLVGVDDEKLEGSSGFTFFLSIGGVLILCSMVSSVLVSTKTSLDFWVELSPTSIFLYHSIELIDAEFLPSKRLEGTLVGNFGLVLKYLPFGSLGLFMKEK